MLLISSFYHLRHNKAFTRPIVHFLLSAAFLFQIGCGGEFTRLRNIKDKDDTPQSSLERLYHKSDFWGGSNGIYISVDKRSSNFGGHNYMSVKIINQSGLNLKLDVKNDNYWFKRYGTKYSLYRRPGSRYPSKISNERELIFDLVGVETFVNVDSIAFVFIKMDSLIITATTK